MNVEKTFAVAQLAYPSLFRYRWQFLNHYFCVIGNGDEWVEGELCAKQPSDAWVEATRIVECGHRPPTSLKEYGDELIRVSLQLYHWYPISEYSALMTVPEDVKQDWLEAAIETAELIAEVSNLQEDQIRNKEIAIERLPALRAMHRPGTLTG